MDPPGRIAAPPSPHDDLVAARKTAAEELRRRRPQPFEIALVRKLESKTASVREAFLLLDVDCDGRISSSDVRAALHNELGLDITGEQMKMVLDRSHLLRSAQDKENRIGGGDKVAAEAAATKDCNAGMSYADFSRYFHEVSSAAYPTSQSGLAAAAGFRRDDAKVAIDGDGRLERSNSEVPIELRPRTIMHKKRHQLRLLFTAHSSRAGSHGSKSGSGMKETSLFLAIDVHRSGRVTMPELLDWINSVGTLDWTLEDLRQVVLGVDEEDGEPGGRKDSEGRWFGRSGDQGEDGAESGEAGMTEREFAEFVESLDAE